MRSVFDSAYTPEQLRCTQLAQLPQLCDELRNALLISVAESGGHLASGLGVVELSVALHYAFDTPHDSLIWDVGHQAYPHKMLTARGPDMAYIKRYGGISGYPVRRESIYDCFGAGHSSTSISAALGMALAAMRAGASSSHIAVIGDGALTSGMAYEAIQHAVSVQSRLIIVLNDNGMSISPNIGGVATCLAGDSHASPSAQQFVQGLGVEYIGPIDGHDVLALVDVFGALKANDDRLNPVLVHVKTIKGKGYQLAEQQPVRYHGVAAFELSKGVVAEASNSAPSFTDVFGQWLVERARSDDRLVAITPAMKEGSGLVAFSEAFPQRFFDVAIAEQHAVTLAAGMACQGDKPVVAIYSTFLQRAYDQLIHDVALQNLDVLFALDRAGIVGEDGATHAGVFDLAFARAIPNLVIMTPSDEDELYTLLNTGYSYDGPVLVRYPKGCGSLQRAPEGHDGLIPLATAATVRQGRGLAILVFGTLLAHAVQAAEVHDATLVDMRFVKPLDAGLVLSMLDQHHTIITIEEGSIAAGVGEEVSRVIIEYCAHSDQALPRMEHLGIGDDFVPYGTRDEILAQQGLDAAGICADITNFMAHE